jgi:DNA-binding NtrC family response regulator
MGGDEVLPVLAERYPDLPVILSTGYSEEQVRSSERPSIVSTLQKPYTASDLVDIVARAVRSVSAPPRNRLTGT